MNRLLSVLFVLPLLATILVLSPTPAAAVGGINLSWGDCGAAGTADKISTCLSNSGANIMVASFAAPMNMPQFNGMSGVVDVTTDMDPMVSWWNAQPGGCRAGAVTGNFDFTGGPFTCNDIWAGGASGGFDYANPLTSGTVASAPATNHSRIRLVCAIGGVPTGVVADGTEYYVFKVTIGNAKSVGTGSCAGCLNKACIVFNSLLLTQPAGIGDALITAALASRTVTWQTGIGASCAAVPVHSKTWGQVKSLYR